MRRKHKLPTLVNICFILALMYSHLFMYGSSKHTNITGELPSFYNCPTELLEWERQDCHPEAGASESACYARGCEWCAAETDIPWCFYNTNQGFSGTCSSATPTGSRVDCYTDPYVSNAKCVNRGACNYCPDAPSGTPWCFYEDSQACLADTTMEFERIDCHPDAGVTKASCENRGCLFCPTSTSEVPWCYYPEDYSTYKITSQVDTAKGSRVTLAYQTSATSLFSDPVTSLAVDVEYQTDDRLRVKIYDTDNIRFEVPMDITSPSTKASNPKYSISFSDTNNFSFKVTRNSNGETIFDSSLSGFTFEDQFIQIATRLETGSYVYGFGEAEHPSLSHDMNWKKYSMWSRDNPPWGNTNIYGVHPYYTVINGGNAHGVLLLNANAQELDLSPLPYLNFRTIGGILDFYFFLGPTPEDVVSQYTEAVGRPYLPPYWALGFQLSHYGYDNISKLHTTVDRIRSYQIPYDVQYGDIDYMDQQRDFTYDTVNYNGLPAYVDTLHSYGMKYIIILDPCIDITVPNYPAYEEGQAENIWVQNDGQPASAKVWPPGTCYFPDYFLDSTQTWWTKQCSDFHNVLSYDGLWIDMNEPANFIHGTLNGCPYNKYNYPPYKPRTLGDVLAEKTTCPDSTQDNGNQLHYNVHSLYGWTQARQTVPAMRAALGGDKRGIVISRSTFPGSGKWTGHWLGDNFSNWYNLRVSIIGCLEFNMFGIPYIGADICGFNDDSSEELCQRWMQLGAFYTFSRNHNGLGWREQDPAVWGSEVARVSRESLEIRYTLLPYLYTLFYHSNVKGSTVMRPMFHEFTSDENAYTIDSQFLWGPAFLISPVLYQSATTVNAYFPDVPWYDYYTGAYVSTRGAYAILSAPMDYIPLHVRGGYILPTQDPAVTTTQSRLNSMGLIVALDDYESATGDLFWDEGDTPDTIENEEYYYATFIASGRSLTSSVVKDYNVDARQLQWGSIRVFGVRSASTVFVNDMTVPYSFNMGTQVLTITDINVSITKAINVSW